jgi:phosphoribulokinase
MTVRHPIVAVTGSSGAGTTASRVTFERIFEHLGCRSATVQGDSFHAYDRERMRALIQKARIRGENFSHFGPGANLLARLEKLFREYGESGGGMVRRYLHGRDEAAEVGQPVGTFTPWERLSGETDVLFYEGLHGGVVTPEVNVAHHVDLLIGVTPIMNLEWIQKIRRDAEERGHAPDDSTASILRRLPDYVNYILPQFSRTDVNFQRVPLVDTSNPFVEREIPLPEETLVVIHFNAHSRVEPDFGKWVDEVPNAFLSRSNTLVVPGTQMNLAMEVILTPAIAELLERRRRPVEALAAETPNPDS